MTTETTAGAETAGGAATGETEATLEQMQANEGAEATGGKETTAETSEAADGAKVKEEKVVPLAALHEERNARKELQRQMAADRQKQAERDAIIERRLQALANPRQEVQVPDKTEQPLDYLDHRFNQISAQQQAILDREQQRDQQNTQQAAIQRLAGAVVQASSAFQREAPDFSEAVAHLNTIRARQLTVLGMPEDQAIAHATQELDQAAMKWVSEGRNPAQIAYEFAKAQGYTPKAQQQQQSANEKIEAQKKGTAAARSLGGGGAPNAGKLTAEALANMSDEDFSKLTDAQFSQAMGG
jgi:hypothetical protein